MGDLNKIIDFGTSADNGTSHRCPVYSGIGPNFNIVTDFNNAHLGNLYIRSVALGSKPETIGSNDASRMNNNPFTDKRSIINGHIRK